ncbi:unnamed protein product [Prunus brigantina]
MNKILKPKKIKIKISLSLCAFSRSSLSLPQQTSITTTNTNPLHPDPQPPPPSQPPSPSSPANLSLVSAINLNGPPIGHPFSLSLSLPLDFFSLSMITTRKLQPPNSSHNHPPSQPATTTPRTQNPSPQLRPHPAPSFQFLPPPYSS